MTSSVSFCERSLIITGCQSTFLGSEGAGGEVQKGKVVISVAGADLDPVCHKQGDGDAHLLQG